MIMVWTKCAPLRILLLGPSVLLEGSVSSGGNVPPDIGSQESLVGLL